MLYCIATYLDYSHKHIFVSLYVDLNGYNCSLYNTGTPQPIGSPGTVSSSGAELLSKLQHIFSAQELQIDNHMYTN